MFMDKLIFIYKIFLKEQIALFGSSIVKYLISKIKFKMIWKVKPLESPHTKKLCYTSNKCRISMNSQPN